MSAVIANAAVSLIAQDSTVIETQSNAVGQFGIQVPAGTYSVKLSAPGFRNKRRKNLVVRASETLDLGTIRLDVADCDSPGVNCDCFTSDPKAPCWADILFRRELTIPKGCGVDLDKGEVSCSTFTQSDIRFLETGERRLVLQAGNRATIGPTYEKAKAHEFRIDNLCRGDDFWVRTKHWQKAHLYLEMNDVSPGTKELILWVTTSKKAN